MQVYIMHPQIRIQRLEKFIIYKQENYSIRQLGQQRDLLFKLISRGFVLQIEVQEQTVLLPVGNDKQPSKS